MIERPILLYILPGTLFWLLLTWAALILIFAAAPAISWWLWFGILIALFVCGVNAWELYKAIRAYPDITLDQRLYLLWSFFLIPPALTAFLYLSLTAMLTWKLSDTGAWDAGLAFLGIAILPLVVLIECIRSAFKILTYRNKKPAEPQPAEPPLTPDERYLDWIREHKPSLPDEAKEVYLEAAKIVVDKYNEERIAPTTDELILARRGGQSIQPLGKVQYQLYEEYKTLASSLPKLDGTPPFPLLPPVQQTLKALIKLRDTVFPLCPWNHEVGPGDWQEWLDQTRNRQIDGSLIYTPFYKLPPLLPIVRNGVKRFESTFILAPSGSGKSTTLQFLISRDLPFVAEGKASVIAMDSTGEFLKDITSLPQFHHDTGTLKDRLIIIEPDLERPFPLNPFALGKVRLKSLSPAAKEQFTNNAIDFITHIFSTVGKEAAFTPRQALLFRQCVKLCLEVDGGSFRDLEKILTTASYQGYEHYVARLDETSRQFFAGQFPSTEFKKVCGEVAWRLSSIMENTTLARMLTAPSCLDLFDELNAGKIVIINTNRAMLGDQRFPILGRLLVALARLAMRERDGIPENKRKPTYFYIDEVHEYLDNDSQVAAMIDDVRKSRLGLVLVTQRLEKLTDPNVRDALLSCGILMANPTPKDAKAIAGYMHTDDESLHGLATGMFGLYARNVTGFTKVTVPPPSSAERISLDDQRRLWETVKKKYAPKVERAPPEPPKNSKPSAEDDHDDEIRPSPP